MGSTAVGGFDVCEKVLKERLGETSRDFKMCPRWVGDSSAEISFVRILSENMRGSMIEMN
jgi:hypothetical protein